MPNAHRMTHELMLLSLVLIVGLIAAITAHQLYFVLLPSRLARGSAATRDRRRKYFEWIAGTPSLGGSWRVPALLHLLQTHVEQGRHPEVVATCRRILGLSQLPAVVASTRGHLADSLEALGDPGAVAERERARAAAVDGDPSNAIALGRTLDRDHRFEEAYDAYRLGLENSPGPPELRVQLLMQMSLSAFNAGRPEDSVACAERAIAEGAEGTLLRTAHRQAGNALKGLGRLDDAEVHKRKAHELAVRGGDPKDVADSAGDLAEILRVRGRLDEALRACDSAIAADESLARQALFIRYEVLKNQGRFAEARDAVARARKTRPYAIPHFEARSRALFSMAEAYLAMISGRPDEAEARVEETRLAFGDDPKLSLMISGAEVRIAALRGDHEAYSAIAESLETRLEPFANAPSTIRGALDSLGKAAVDVGDFEYGVDCWERYLALDPLPVDRPTGLYFLGLCRDGLGGNDDARALFREAADSGIDTYYARLAREKLAGSRLG